MYKYEDFQKNFGDKYSETKMLKIYSQMEIGKQYSTEGLFNLRDVHGDSWETLSCIDRLEELGMIYCHPYSKKACRNFWQYVRNK